MEIKINYDLISKIKDYKEPLSPLKLIRHTFRVNRITYFSFPLYVFIGYAINRNSFGRALGDGLFMYSSSFLPCFYMQYFSKSNKAQDKKGDLNTNKSPRREDYLKKKAEPKLKSLCAELKDNGVNTSFEQLIESQFEGADYRIKLNKVNKRRLLQIVETKHILVPTTNHFDNEVMVPIDQVHVLGSNKYTLQRGIAKRKTVPVPAMSAA